MPLLVLRMLGVTPLLAVNHVMAMMSSDMSSEVSTSRCTARTAMQVNMHPHLFSCLLHNFTVKGLKQSSPVAVNGGPLLVTWSSGRSACLWHCGFQFILLHVTNRLVVLFTTRLMCSIQNFLHWVFVGQ